MFRPIVSDCFIRNASGRGTSKHPKLECLCHKLFWLNTNKTQKNFAQLPLCDENQPATVVFAFASHRTRQTEQFHVMMSSSMDFTCTMVYQINRFIRCQVKLAYRKHKCLTPLRWRQNGRDSVSNHQPHDCLFNRLFRRRSKKTSKLRVTGLCVGNS